MKNDRVLVLAFNLYKGGSLQIHDFLVSSLLESNLENDAILVTFRSKKILDKLSGRRLKYVCVRYPLKFKLVNALYRLLLEQILPLFYVLFYGISKVILFNNIPVVIIPGRMQSVYFHNMNYFSENSLQSYYFKLALILKFQTKYFVQSPVVQYELSKRFKGRVYIALHPFSNYYNAEKLESDNLKGLKTSEKFLFYPAYYYPHKNHQLLVSINQVLSKLGVKVMVTLRDEEFAEVFKYSSNIVNVGHLTNPQVMSLIASATAVINVSESESLMIPIIEAMVLGKPVITLDKEYSRFLLGPDGYYFKDVLDFESALLALLGCKKVVEYDLSHMDCSLNEFVKQFIE